MPEIKISEMTELATAPDNAVIPIVSGGVNYKITKANLLADAYDITAFAASSATLEIGATATAPAFTASHNKTPTSLVLTNNDNGESKNVVGTPGSFTSSQNYTKTANNASVTFTLTGGDGVDTDARTAAISWRPRVYHGIGAAGLSTEAHIEALASSALQSSRATSYTDNATGANHLYFACPTSYGTPTFTVGGFEGGFSLVSDAISVTNANGVNQVYQLWVSDVAGLGSTSVVVS
jgi:hypothetical protein